MGSSTDCLRQLARIARPVTPAEREARVKKIATELEDAGVEATGWITDEDGTSRLQTLEDIACTMYFFNPFGGGLLGTVIHYDQDPSPATILPRTDEPPCLLPQTGTKVMSILERMALSLERIVGVNQPSPAMQPVERTQDASLVVVKEPAAFGRMEAKLEEIACGLTDIRDRLTAELGEVVKEAYTVEEVAKKTKLAPFTIRQACNKKRIKDAYKGRDHAWRIPHASLLDILSNGLPPE